MKLNKKRPKKGKDIWLLDFFNVSRNFVDYMKKRFYVVGGNIRDLLRFSADLSTLKKLMSSAIGQISSQSLRSIENISIAQDIPSRGYSIWAEGSDNVESYRIEFSSEFTKLYAMYQLCQNSWSSTLDLFNNLHDAKIGGGLQGRIFETVAHKALQYGVKDLPVRKLVDDDTGVNPNWFLKENIKKCLKTALNDVDKLLGSGKIKEDKPYAKARRHIQYGTDALFNIRLSKAQESPVLGTDVSTGNRNITNFG